MLLRNAPVFRRAAQKIKRSQKQDQSGILAQKFSSCGNLLTGIFRDVHSSLESFAVSSTASITAAQNVQERRECQDDQQDFLCDEIDAAHHVVWSSQSMRDHRHRLPSPRINDVVTAECAARNS